MCAEYSAVMRDEKSEWGQGGDEEDRVGDGGREVLEYRILYLSRLDAVIMTFRKRYMCAQSTSFFLFTFYSLLSKCTISFRNGSQNTLTLLQLKMISSPRYGCSESHSIRV